MENQPNANTASNLEAASQKARAFEMNVCPW